MTDEDRIIELMTEQNRLRAEIDQQIEPAETPTSRQAAMLVSHNAQLREQHQAIVGQLVELLDSPLRAAFAGSRPRMEQAGVQYTEMVHDFFVKLWERKVKLKADDPIRSFDDIRKLVSTVLFNQVRDFIRVETGRREIEREGLAPLVAKRQKYWNDRYSIEFRDMMIELDGWLNGDNDERRMIAEMVSLRYIVGEKWGEIARLLSVNDERLNKLRIKAGQQFQVRP